MWDRAGQCQIDELARSGEARRHDVPELEHLRYPAVEGDPEHAIVVPIGDQDPALIRLKRILEPRRHVEGRRGRIVQRELADVGNHREAVRTVDPVDPHDVAAAQIRPDQRDQNVRRAADEGDIDCAAEAYERRRQALGHRGDRPRLCIDARQLPTAPSVT